VQVFFVAGYLPLSGPLIGATFIGNTITNNFVNPSGINNGEIEAIQLLDDFDDVNLLSNVIQNNTGSNSGTDIGIDVRVFNARTSHTMIVENNKIASCDIGVNISAGTNGIYQNNTFNNLKLAAVNAIEGSSCNSINNNYAVNVASGFVDTANPSTNLFANNKVFASTNAYAITYPFGPVPVSLGSLEAGFPASPLNAEDNVFISSETCN
jgi:hypothetical protein